MLTERVKIICYWAILACGGAFSVVYWASFFRVFVIALFLVILHQIFIAPLLREEFSSKNTVELVKAIAGRYTWLRNIIAVYGLLFVFFMLYFAVFMPRSTIFNGQHFVYLFFLMILPVVAIFVVAQIDFYKKLSRKEKE